jgi:hypothetical protein
LQRSKASYGLHKRKCYYLFKNVLGGKNMPSNMQHHIIYERKTLEKHNSVTALKSQEAV